MEQRVKIYLSFVHLTVSKMWQASIILVYCQSSSSSNHTQRFYLSIEVSPLCSFFSIMPFSSAYWPFWKHLKGLFLKFVKRLQYFIQLRYFTEFLFSNILFSSKVAVAVVITMISSLRSRNNQIFQATIPWTFTFSLFLLWTWNHSPLRWQFTTICCPK